MTPEKQIALERRAEELDKAIRRYESGPKTTPLRDLTDELIQVKQALGKWAK